MKKALFVSLILASVSILIGFTGGKQENPKISFTFDDGSTKDYENYELQKWNQMILDNLQKHDIKAVLFASGQGLASIKGKYILASWDNAGHKIGNHTFSHPSLNSKLVTAQMFEREILKNDSIIKDYNNYFPYFRFPYLKEGNTVEKRDSIRNYLAATGYRNGYVTIDASDWYVNSRLNSKLKNNTGLNLKPYKDFYIQHIFERACFYDSLAQELTNQRIHHTLLLHHNLTSALFLDDLIQHFKENGWEIEDAHKAYEDNIFNVNPDIIPAGESLIWALAKESGNYDSILRYPGEGSGYEKDKMDKLGL